MKANLHNRRPGGAVLLLALFVLALAVPAPLQAQQRPSQRQLRTYIPPDQLVSFLPSTPFDQFVDFVNPIFQRVTGKEVIDPETRTDPIGVDISGMHFLDALERVLESNDLTYRENDRYFMIEEAAQPASAGGLPQVASAGGGAVTRTAAEGDLPSLNSREIQINAVLFELNNSKARDQGVDWNVFFGTETGSTIAPGNENRFSVRTSQFFRGTERFLSAPQAMDVGTLTNFFRYLEDQGLGETIASPSVTVQSGHEGRIQIGSDVPVQTRDFAGNTLTQFISTGIIINVKPTLVQEYMADSLGGDLVDFIHLDVEVDKSSSRPSGAGPVIDRNTAKTQVLLLDGEQTSIGGLYSNEQSTARRGVPILKDLPGWFFGLRYIFGKDQKTDNQKELFIVLQARLLDPLHARAQEPFRERLLEQRRGEVMEGIRRVDDRLIRNVRMTEPGTRGRKRTDMEKHQPEQ